MIKSIPFRIGLFLFLTLATAAQAGPRDELLRLVPDDMSFCFVVQDIRERSKDTPEHSIAARLLQMPLVRSKLQSAEFKKLIDAKDHVLRDLQITPEQLRDELLGDAVVLAYRQGAKEQDQGLFLVWARDQALLAKVADRFNDVQSKTGELKELKSLTYNDQPYQRRIKVKDQQTTAEFYFIRDHVLVLSLQESLLKAVIDRDRGQPAAAKEPPFWSKTLQRLGFDKSAGALLVNPRVFDEQIKAREQAAKADDRAFVKEFRKYWEACDSLGAAFDLRESAEVSLAVSARTEALPAAGRRFLGELGKPSALWKAIPDEPLLAVSSRIDLAAFAETFASFCDDVRLKSINQALEAGMGPFLAGRGKLDVFKKGVGPDWGFWVAAPANADKTWLPQSLLAIRLQDNAEGATAEKVVRGAVQFLATAAQFRAKDQFRVEYLQQDGTEITFLVHERLFPAGFRPAFAIKEGYLLLASSPEAIQRFSTLGKDNAAPSEEVPLLRMSAKAWRPFLAQYKNEAAEFLARSSGTPVKENLALIDAAIENLKPLDRFEIIARSKPNQSTLIFRLKGTAPAK